MRIVLCAVLPATISLVSALGGKNPSPITFEVPASREIQLLPIPEGNYEIGSDVGDSDERPQHTVHLSHPYWLATTEVTAGQYLAFLEATGETDHIQLADYDCPLVRRDGGFTLRGTGFGRSLDQPIVEVDWHGAVAFCRWLNQLYAERLQAMSEETPYVFALPTEAQWEIACRRSDQASDIEDLSAEELLEYAWLKPNSGGVTHPVATRKPTGAGFYDLHGNAWEWCLDHCEWDGGVVTDVWRDGITNPLDTSGKLRVYRGSCWFSQPSESRPSARYRLGARKGYHASGFRVALVADPEGKIRTVLDKPAAGPSEVYY